jgi:hypothetical protein
MKHRLIIFFTIQLYLYYKYLKVCPLDADPNNGMDQFLKLEPEAVLWRQRSCVDFEQNSMGLMQLGGRLETT